MPNCQLHWTPRKSEDRTEAIEKRGIQARWSPSTEVEKEEGEGGRPPCLKVEVIVCFSLLLPFLYPTSPFPLPGFQLGGGEGTLSERRNEKEPPARPCHVFRMNLHDVPACSYVTFCQCACVRTRTRASMWAEIPCSGRCWTIFAVCAPSRYETRHDYTLSGRRGQGRIVLPDSSAPRQP